MALVTKVMGVVEECAKSGDYLSLYSTLTNEAYSKVVSDESWTIISSIFKQSDCVRKASVRDSLQKVMNYLAKCGKPKLMVYAFLEQVESYADPYILSLILPSLTISVDAIDQKQKLTIEVVLEALCTQVSKMPLPSSYCITSIDRNDPSLFGGKPLPVSRSNKLDDNNVLETGRKRISGLLRSVTTVLDFGQHFVHAVDREDLEFRTEYVKFILKLFNFPMKHFLCKKSDEEAIKVCASLMRLLEKVVHNIVLFATVEMLVYQEEAVSVPTTAPENPQEYDESSQLETLAFVHFLDITGWVSPCAIPLVYDAVFVFNTHVRLMCTLLEDPAKVASIWRGLQALVEHLNRIGAGAFHYTLAEDNHFRDLSTLLCKVTTYCSVREYRRVAVNLLSMIPPKFDSRGRYMWLLFLLHSSLQVSLRGHVITLCQKEINRFWDTGDRYFDSQDLVQILEQVFQWAKPDSARQLVDLPNMSEAILPALNLAKFILLRDKLKSRLLLMRLARQQYLNPLAEFLRPCRAFYIAEMKRMNEGGAPTPVRKADERTSLLVNGQPYDGMSEKEQKMVLSDGFTKLDLIDFQLQEVLDLFN